MQKANQWLKKKVLRKEPFVFPKLLQNITSGHFTDRKNLCIDLYQDISKVLRLFDNKN